MACRVSDHLESTGIKCTPVSLLQTSSLRAALNIANSYIAPSGVQKERILPEHIFVLPFPQPNPSPHTDRVFLRKPHSGLKESACTPLFWNAFELRDAGSCIHTHSQHALMATLLWKEDVFKVSHLEVSYLLSYSYWHRT
jgi:ribulose-5-phosphate 4-epimerase/fuculose-1-phosphate aldolase